MAQIKQIPLRNQVRDRIAEQLWKGVYSFGDDLNEAQLATELGVSRTPLREGLVRRASDGLIDALRKDASGELLDEVDLFVIYAALGQTFDTWEAAHFQYLNGYLPEEHWQSTLREIPQVLGSLRYAEYWENSRHSYLESFAEMIVPLVPPQRGGPE